MKLLEIVTKALADAKEHDEYIAKQHQYRMMFQRYKNQYWFMALVLDEAIKANLLSLKVQVPSMPKLLMPTNQKPKNINDFSFILMRHPQNTPCSDSTVLPQEASMVLTDYFSACGFANFKIICEEDTYKYYLTVHKLDKFCFGRMLSPGIGEICFNPNLYNPYTNAYGMYDIKFYNGGTCGGLWEGKKFLLYDIGIWNKASVALNDPHFQTLTLTGKHMENYVGWIARI